MDTNELIQLVKRIYSSHEAEIDCDTCDEEMSCLAELASAGYDPRLMLPAVQAHMDCCVSCRESFRALLCILKAQQSGEC